MKRKNPKSERSKSDDWGALQPDNPDRRPPYRLPKPVRLADDPVEVPEKPKSS